MYVDSLLSAHCVCVCVCACVIERKREREGERARQRERERVRERGTERARTREREREREGARERERVSEREREKESEGERDEDGGREGGRLTPNVKPLTMASRSPPPAARGLVSAMPALVQACLSSAAGNERHALVQLLNLSTNQKLHAKPLVSLHSASV